MSVNTPKRFLERPEEQEAKPNDYLLLDNLTLGTRRISVQNLLNPPIPVHDYTNVWDFKRSLDDSVGGITAELKNNLVRDSQGLKFAHATDILRITGVNLIGKTIEIDVDSFNFIGNTDYNIRFLMINATSSTFRGRGPLIWRHNTNIGWTCFTFQATSGTSTWWGSPWGDLSGSSSEVINAFNGKTVKLRFLSLGNVELYLDDVLIGTKTGQFYRTADNLVEIGGAYSSNSQSSGDQCYNMTISGVRIYLNEE